MIDNKLIKIVFHILSMTLLSIATILLIDFVLRGNSFLTNDFSQEIDDQIALDFTYISIPFGLISCILLFKQWYDQKSIQLYLGYILFIEIALLISILLLIQV